MKIKRSIKLAIFYVPGMFPGVVCFTFLSPRGSANDDSLQQKALLAPVEKQCRERVLREKDVVLRYEGCTQILQLLSDFPALGRMESRGLLRRREKSSLTLWKEDEEEDEEVNGLM